MKKITLDEAIEYFDEQCANQFSRENKIAWISELDELIYDTIIKERENPPVAEFNGYDNDTDGDTELLVPSIYKEIYRYYLEKNVNYANREIGAFNNAVQIFDSIYENYFAWYNRTHKSVTTAQFNI